MKITKDIDIDISNLTKNSDIIINYSGILDNSNEIFANFGYTPNTFEYKKEKLNNKSIKIHLEKPGYFYFYFNDENNNIDNNNNKDYQLYIKKSSLIFTDNSSMKELPFKFIQYSDNNFYKTFYTSQTLKNTSKPQEIIIPRPFNSKTPTSETKNIDGFHLEPVKPLKDFQLSQTLIPTEHLDLLQPVNKKNETNLFSKINLSINKLLLAIPKLFGKNYS